MARGNSLDAPVTLEDSYNGEFRYLPVPAPILSARRRNTQTLDQDDIEEVDHHTAWEQAVAQRAKAKKKQEQLRNLTNLTKPYPQDEHSGIPEPPFRRPSSVKPIAIIDLLTDDDESTRPRVTQQGADAGPNQTLLHAQRFSSHHPESSSNTGIPQETRPCRIPTTQPTVLNAVTARPAYMSPYSMQPPILRPSETAHEAVQSSGFPLRMSPVRPLPSVPINAILNHDTFLTKSFQDTNLVPLSSHKPDEIAVHDTVPSFLPPIGVLAGHQRERTTCRRVNITSERANVAGHPDKLEPPPPMAAEAYTSSSSSVTVFPPKQKAIKSVRQRNYVPLRTSPRPSTNKDDSPCTPQDEPHQNSNKAASRTASRSPFRGAAPQTSTVLNNEVRLTERPKDRNATLDRLPLEPQERAGGTSREHFENPGHHAYDCAAPSVNSSISPSLESDQNLKALGVRVDSAANMTPIGDPSREATPLSNDVSPNLDEVRSALANHVHDLTATQSAIDACLKRHVAERHEMHAQLTRIKMRNHRTCQERDLRARYRKEKRVLHSTLPEEFIQHTSPFAHMPAIQMSFDRNCASKGLPDIGQEIFIKAKPKDPVVRSTLSAPTTKYRSEAVIIPPFKEYVSLKNNILADNESKLLATPYFEDEDYESRQALLDALPYMYELTHDEKGPLDLRKEQCRFYKTSIEAFLKEIGVTWDNVLYWLLAPDHTLKHINASISGSESFSTVVLERSQYNIEEFERDGEIKTTTLFDRGDEKWRSFLLQLEEPSVLTLRLAATACAAVFQECEFSIWYLAEQSSSVQENVWRKTSSGKNAAQSAYRQIVCRVCHQHNCLLHGELRQAPEDSWKSESEEEDEEFQSSRCGSRSTLDEDTDPLPAHFDEDSDIEKVINYKLPANPDAFNVCPESEMITSRGAKPPPGKFNAHWWLQRDLTQHWEKRKPFFPCNHEGSCENAKCRECDADLCGACGATEILDPVNRYNKDVMARNCFNVAIQRGVPRKTLLGHSEVHGFGLYMGEDIEKGEYIGEYTGEVISVHEGNRRLTIYDYQKTMYLFRLNSKQEVDATYMGNKLRFINNADDKYTNCAPRNLLCNTVFRIALFATTNIKAGTELYFNYNYPKEKTAQFKQPNGKVVAVKENKPKTKKADGTVKRKQPGEERDRSRILAATAKARAAKAAKRQAMLEEAARLAAARPSAVPFQARKTATATPSVKPRSKLRQRVSRNESVESDGGLDEDEDEDEDASDAEASAANASQETTASQSQYVGDVDGDDEEFVVDDTEENDDEQSHSWTKGSSATSRYGPSRPRRRTSNVTPVMASQKKTGKMGGARPGAGRKRKRPVILNSDDE
ncbi:hypothetical protein yc1106_09915 [Curvularia clavata]|uniref:SET domain-containing protein n=1 Tax=Curvularia clavata TaxID=95742 RepID=A0A9Q9DYI4_CURCL|nr:hypothetical protein yc1106_09915 [Curvularia clavata]